MPLVRRPSAVLLSATILGGAAFLVEPAQIRNVEVGLDGGRLAIGAIRMPLLGAAFAQTTDQIVLENVTLDLGFVAYKAKRIEFNGVTTSRADLEALFEKASAASLADRFARISARQIVIPELVSEATFKGVTQSSTNRNVVLAGVGQGRVGQITSESSLALNQSPDGPMTSRSGTTTASDLDVSGMMRVYSESAGAGPQEMRKLVGSFSMQDLQIAGPKGMAVSVARAGGQDFYAKPIPGGLTGFLQRIMDIAQKEKPDQQELIGLLPAYGDMLGAVDYGLFEVVGISVTPPKTDGVEGSARIARMAYSGAVSGRVPDARMEGFEVATSKGTARIGTIAFTGFSFPSTAEGLRGFREPSAAFTPEALRKLVPTIGTIRFSGLDFDLPNTEPPNTTSPGSAVPQRVQFKLRDLEVTADRPQNGIPTNVRLALQNFAMPIPAGARQDGLRELAGLGYKDVDLSFTTAASWQEPGEVVIREISTRLADGGSVSLKGLLGNVTKDVFNPDSAVAMVALIGATARNLELTVENDGLFDRFLAQQAAQQGKSAEVLRREFATAAALGIPAVLGNSPQSKGIAQAIGRFIAKPVRLTIAAKTREAAGLGFADVMSLSEPADIFDKLDVTATAE